MHPNGIELAGKHKGLQDSFSGQKPLNIVYSKTLDQPKLEDVFPMMIPRILRDNNEDVTNKGFL